MSQPRTQPPKTPRTGIWVTILTVCCALALISALLPSQIVSAFTQTISNAVGAGAVLAAVRWKRDLSITPAWLLFGIALSSTTVGHVLWYSLSLNGAEGYLLVPNTLYLIGYLLLAAGVWRYGRGFETGAEALLDALMIVVAAAVLFWALLITPYAQAGQTMLSLVFSATYPVVDLLLLALVLKLVFMSMRPTKTISMLLAALTVIMGVDVAHAFGFASGWYEVGGILDVLWIIPYGLVGAAAWHPSAAEFPDVRPNVIDQPMVRLTIIGITGMSVPVVVLFTAENSQSSLYAGALAAMVLFLLMMVRLGLALERNRRQAAELEELVRTDPLTKAANRRAMEERLHLELERARRTGQPMAVAFLDLDYFKRYNDRYGHAAGDELLRDMVASWHAQIRPADLLARFGGEEFVLICPDSDHDAAVRLLERLRARIPYHQTCSAGFTLYREGDVGDIILHRADQALYMAKHRGRDQIAFHPHRAESHATS